MVVTKENLTQAVRGASQEYLFPCQKAVYKEPLVLVEGNGTLVTDSEGNQYLDFFAGILSTSVGHCNPEVVERVQQQVARLGHVSSFYLNEPQAAAAGSLARIAPGSLKKTFFTNSGTEAVETAIMMARMYTGRDEIVALRYAYSGRSALATNMTAQSVWRPLSPAIPWIKHALSPYCYRCPFGPPHDDCAEKFARDLEEVIVTTTSGKPAAFFAEAIQGLGGFIVPPPGYFERAAEIIHRYGGLLIIDEVQTGFGRTGDKWFGIEHWGVEPDIMVMAKGIANGFPVGATTTRDEIAEAWEGKTISTFGGNPICMAAVDATLNIMVREDVPSRSAERGKQLRTGLEALYEEYSWIGDVRGKGLMLGIELVEDRTTKEPGTRKGSALLEATREEGLLIGVGGMHGHVARVAPQMLVTEEEVAEALARLGRACRKVSSSS